MHTDLKRSRPEIERISCALVKALKANWSDSMLSGEVLMRQAGLKVPGGYGPAREEWAAMGMQPME